MAIEAYFILRHVARCTTYSSHTRNIVQNHGIKHCQTCLLLKTLQNIALAKPRTPRSEEKQRMKLLAH
jgi:hypothetical protein